MDEKNSAAMNLALEKLEAVMGRIEAQYEALNAKVDRIVACVEEKAEVKASARISASTRHRR